MPRYDAVVVGSGPNGLAAAIVLARAGRAVLVREGASTLGGGARTEALTRPGYLHDVFSAVHPLALASPFFRRLPLEAHGLEWIRPPAAAAHPLDDGTAVLLETSIDNTCAGLGPDGPAYRALVEPFASRWEDFFEDVLAPLHLPLHPRLLVRFGRHALLPATWIARFRLRGPRARALFAGMAAHSALPLTTPPSAAFGLVLAVAGHAPGWPLPRGGAAGIAGALLSYFRSLGGEVLTGAPVRSLAELRPAPVVLLDQTPRQILAIAGDDLPSPYRRQLTRYRYGPGSFKLDWALSGPIPWTAPECARAATVHLGGSAEGVVAAEAAPWRGEHAARPFVLLVQPSLFDPTRAPPGHHTAWAYAHVPSGSTTDHTAAVEGQVERFAPGFRDRIVARHVMGPLDLQRRNPNLVGGDVGGGASDLRQLFFRPVARLNPYTTPLPGVFICSSSSPPGGGVHGMCGYYAAHAALRHWPR